MSELCLGRPSDVAVFATIPNSVSNNVIKARKDIRLLLGAGIICAGEPNDIAGPIGRPVLPIRSVPGLRNRRAREAAQE
eukprot:11108019-Heterocapsa_arctica.AAC.1